MIGEVAINKMANVCVCVCVFEKEVKRIKTVSSSSSGQQTQFGLWSSSRAKDNNKTWSRPGLALLGYPNLVIIYVSARLLLRLRLRRKRTDRNRQTARISSWKMARWEREKQDRQLLLLPLPIHPRSKSDASYFADYLFAPTYFTFARLSLVWALGGGGGGNRVSSSAVSTVKARKTLSECKEEEEGREQNRN